VDDQENRPSTTTLATCHHHCSHLRRYVVEGEALGSEVRRLSSHMSELFRCAARMIDPLAGRNRIPLCDGYRSLLLFLERAHLRRNRRAASLNAWHSHESEAGLDFYASNHDNVRRDDPRNVSVESSTPRLHVKSTFCGACWGLKSTYGGPLLKANCGTVTTVFRLHRLCEPVMMLSYRRSGAS